MVEDITEGIMTNHPTDPQWWLWQWMPPGGNNGGIGCPNCRVLNAPGARFCQQCGMSLVPVACTQCGASLQASTKFGQCGKSVT